ncbi:MAG: phenylalanine--tRNA ligase subunit beta [Desulfobulbaceae bacterium]|jgi:phenylalanyl-tRNA synthetase beta chain|nr:phenylalanine--tRNA ligase subunit beta [Desulfobulbaceae bacterium]
MKFTFDWLRDYVAVNGCDAARITDILTMLGLEVDSAAALYEDLAPLRTGRIVAASKHPDADNLQVCQVKIGAETHTIVCGAPNARKGLAVVVAMPGTTLPGDMKIKKAKVRGIESAGMICSERELGLSHDHSGIMELPDGTEDGQVFIDALGMRDTLFEVELTPNRPDCAAVIGIARELAGKLAEPLCLPAVAMPDNPGSASFSVTIEAPELCPRYSARLVKGVKIAPSPWWLRKRLMAIGLRPINNVVDITNYVMMEYGQPLHAFDFDTLAGSRIIVRAPGDVEKHFVTLDGSERALDDQTLLICDGEKPVALAGVMGGLNSEVTAKTVNVLLESACFAPVSIRKTARLLGLVSDASWRFERGVDVENTITVLNRAAALLVEVAGGSQEAGWIDVYPGKKQPLAIPISAARTSRLIGVRFSSEEIISLLTGIGIVCKKIDDDLLHVTPPAFRVDLEREADLVEEVARLYGYDAIPMRQPLAALSYPDQDLAREKRLRAAAIMTSLGYHEAINYSFTTSKFGDMLSLAADDARRRAVRLRNPLSEEMDCLRSMLLPGLLENIRRNISYQNTSIKLFEIGKVFVPKGQDVQPDEKVVLSGVLTGNSFSGAPPLHFPERAVDIFDARGAVEFLLEEMGIPCGADVIRVIHPFDDGIDSFAEPETALIFFAGGAVLGKAGMIKPAVLRAFGVKQDVAFFTLDFDALCALPVKKAQFAPLPAYPAVTRDIALLVADRVAAGDMVEAVRASGEKLIESVALFDIFRGGSLPPGTKSVALSITYRSASKTLTEKNINKTHEKIVRLLTDTFGGSLRAA